MSFFKIYFDAPVDGTIVKFVFYSLILQNWQISKYCCSSMFTLYIQEFLLNYANL